MSAVRPGQTQKVFPTCPSSYVPLAVINQALTEWPGQVLSRHPINDGCYYSNRMGIVDRGFLLSRE